MPRATLVLTLVIGVGCAVDAFGQHPATVFPGNPSMPGLNAPVAFPSSPDPRTVERLPPGTAILRTSSDWERQVAARSTKLRLMNGPGTNQELKQELLSMVEADRLVRVSVGGPALQTVTAESGVIDRIEESNTIRLKAIIAQSGWPTIALVGAEASQAAGVILAHSADHLWQQQLVPQLQQFVATDKISGFDVAPIVDNLLVLSGKAQKFGTQFEIRNGTIVILPVQDPQQLEPWRSQYLLPPVSVFRTTLESIYRLPVKGPA